MFPEEKGVIVWGINYSKNTCRSQKKHENIFRYVDKTLELISTYSKIEGAIV